MGFNMRGCGALLLAVLVTQVAAHEGHDEGMGMGAGPPMSDMAGGGMDMPMGGTGSANMTAACYSDPANPDCATFARADEDWMADIEMLCEAMPFMVGCTLADQCMSGAAAGEYCEPSSLAANLCVDMPKMMGCEAWNALCGPSSAVEQCTAPGPIPTVPTTFPVKDALEALCGYHCMDGCPACEAGKTWNTCTDPLAVLARMCYEMPDMPECKSTSADVSGMCGTAAVASTFPLVCTSPPENAAKC